MSDKSLTPEEQEYFASGGVSSLPDDYAKDVPPPQEEDTPPAAQTDNGQNEGDGGAPQAKDGEGKPQGEPGKEGGEGESPRGPVPYGALKTERERRKEAERRAHLLEERFNMTLDMMQRNQPQPQQAPQQEQKPQPVDLDADPLGAIRSIYDWKNEQEEQQRSRQEQERQHAAQRQVEERVVSDYRRVMTDAFEEHPETKDAYEYLINSRIRELMAGGMPEQQAVQAAARDEYQVAYGALSQRQHPASHIVAYAQARGWQHPSNRQPQGDGKPDSPSGQQQRPNNDAERLASVAAGQKANASIGAAGTGASPRGGRVDAKALADMSDKDFKAFLAKDKDGDEWKRVMGA